MGYIDIKHAVDRRLLVVDAYTKPKTQQEKEPEEEKGEKEKHPINVADACGNVCRDGSHPYWGYRYMMGFCAKNSVGYNVGANVEKRRKIYSEFDFVDTAYEPDVAKILKKKYKLASDDATPDANFCKQAWRENKKNKSGKSYAGQRYPYNWQSHHIIPDEIFNGAKVFSDLQRERIIAAGYNINHGHNIIFLPGNGGLKYTFVHGLIQHLGSHPKYAIEVKNMVEDISSEIPEEADDKKKHETIKATVKNIRALEHSIWEKLVKASRNSIKGEKPENYISTKKLEDNNKSFKLS